MRTAEWARGEATSLLDVPGLGPNKLKALLANEIVTISDFLAATDEKLWSILGPLQGRPTDPQRASEVLAELRQNARDAAVGNHQAPGTSGPGSASRGAATE